MYTDGKEQLYAMGIIFRISLFILAALAVSTPAVICYVWQRIVD